MVSIGVKSPMKPLTRRFGQEVKTPPFHGGITSSTLVRVTKLSGFGKLLSLSELDFFIFYEELVRLRPGGAVIKTGFLILP